MVGGADKQLEEFISGLAGGKVGQEYANGIFHEFAYIQSHPRPHHLRYWRHQASICEM